MPKIPNCDRCIYCAHDYHLVCVPHPEGPDSVVCPDFSPDPTLTGKRFFDFLGLGDSDSNEELWEPEGAIYYNEELILQPRPRLSKARSQAFLSTLSAESGWKQVSLNRPGNIQIFPECG